MAMKFLRFVQFPSGSVNTSLPMRASLTASMSSSSPLTPKIQEKDLDKVYPKADGTIKRESLRSKLASVFGGYVEPADPKQAPFPSEEVNFSHQVDRATGEEKLFLLAFENGIFDPYCNLPVERGSRGLTKDDAVPIESFMDYRMVACLCEPAKNSHRFNIFYKGETKRCQCGYWHKVVDAPRFWEKIPKEDLVQIEEFRKLDALGKLDKFLETGKLDNDQDHGHH